MPEQPLALVLGDLDMVQALVLGGIPCALLTSSRSSAHLSRHVMVRVAPEDPWVRPAQFSDRLLEFAAMQAERPVLFPQGDAELLAVSRDPRLRDAYRTLLPEPALVEQLVDKAAFATLADRLGLPVPRTLRVPPGTPAADPGDLSFPLVVKPLTRRDSEWSSIGGRAKARLVEDLDELQAMWPTIAGTGLDVVLQEAVPGPESRVESYHAYVAADGEIAAAFSGRKLRTLPLRFGHSTALEVTSTADVHALGAEIVTTLGLRGMAKLDFKRAPDGSLRLLEVNPRCTLWHHPGAIAGVNLAAMMYADLTDNPRPRVQPARPGVRWCLPLDDARAARADHVSARRWLGFLLRCEARSGLSWNDPLPFLGTLSRALWTAAARR